MAAAQDPTAVVEVEQQSGSATANNCLAVPTNAVAVANAKSQCANVVVVAGGGPLGMSLREFAAMFPTHVCFNRQLVVEHCG